MAQNIISGGQLTANNVQILNAVRDIAPADYQSRIPIATQSNVASVLRAMNQYTPNWDMFWNLFVGRIGRTLINNRMGFTNPLAFAQRSAMSYGNTAQEIQINLLKARSYDPNGANVFGREGREPDMHVAYHQQDRADKYEINIPMEQALRGAFAEGESIAALFNACLAAPIDSNEHDRMLLELRLFNSGVDLYNVQVPELSLSDDHMTAQENVTKFARAVRAMVTNFGYYSTNYSEEGRENGLATRGADPVLIMSATADACMSVDMYQYAFHKEDGAVPVERIVTIADEYMPTRNGVRLDAILLDKDALIDIPTLGPVMLDSGMNPANMSYNYFYHVWEIISLSKFLPIVAFSQAADTDVTKLESTYSTVTLADSKGKTEGTFDAGSVIPLTATVTGTNSPNQAVYYTIEGYVGNRTYALPSDCYVDSTGNLHIGSTRAGAQVRVTAHSVEREGLSASYDATVAGFVIDTFTATQATGTLGIGKSNYYSFTVTGTRYKSDGTKETGATPTPEDWGLADVSVKINGNDGYVTLLEIGQSADGCTVLVGVEGVAAGTVSIFVTDAYGTANRVNTKVTVS